MSSPGEIRAGQEHEATPLVSELELESAILKGVASHRPVGQHKHVLIIALQSDVHSQTGIWVPVPSLWKTLDDLYDLEALDNMSSSTPSLPGSPDPLSPIPNPRRRRPARDSASPLSSPSPSPPRHASRSARVIDSPHFRSAFELPLNFGQEGDSRRGSTGSAGTPAPGEEDELDFASLLYARAKGEEEEDAWEAGVRAQLASEGPGAGAGAGSGSGSGTGKKRAQSKSLTGSRRTSGGTTGTVDRERERRDTSPLSSASHDAPRRGTRRKKRPRGDGESSEEERERDKPAARKSRRRGQ